MSTIHGGDNADTVDDYAGQTNDIDARGGNDLIYAAVEQAVETINGGDGVDTISYVNLHGVHVDIDKSEIHKNKIAQAASGTKAIHTRMFLAGRIALISV